MDERESSKYRFPETLNQQKRWLGLPPEEAFILLGCGLLGFYIDMFIVMLVVGAVLWLLIRHLKKGQGSWWLLNLLYWYLPTMLFRVQFRRVPDSANRHWMQ
ncbi:type IV conjugative transfer system protein TraL [Pantoea sp. OXWO6B1]|uniref:type IV conjugative transfer system protein TraL n=1 Tax=Pantoea sp. OXWO6B1 TaxID=1835724 RepID=UPI0007C7EF37|nr:type IV conjugative transfer system protein TraL [Pantoea sp. OXWO6B1]OAD97897.1 conjugal transfer protein TraL [Pantoea sp. OXWO6B1]